MIKMRVLFSIGLALALALTLGAGRASADLTLSLGAGNAAINSFPGPYATVNVALSGDTATFTFTGNTVMSGGTTYVYLLGGQGAAGLNLNATNWTLGAIAGVNTYSGFTPGPYSNGGSGNEDGFGNFNQTIDSFDGYTHSATTLTFSVTNNTAGAWTSAANVLTANGDGFLAAAHIFVATLNPNGTLSSDALNTGYARDNGTIITEATPEPSTMALAALGALGYLGYGLRRRLSK